MVRQLADGMQACCPAERGSGRPVCEEQGEEAHHDEDQVGQLPQHGVLAKRLDQRGDVLLGVRARHRQDGRLAGVAQEAGDVLQEADVWVFVQQGASAPAVQAITVKHRTDWFRLNRLA